MYSHINAKVQLPSYMLLLATCAILILCKS